MCIRDRKQGVSIADVNTTLGSLLGSNYINDFNRFGRVYKAVSYTHLRAHETPEHIVCRLLLEKKKNKINKIYSK